jgi:methylthioribulose 1-phosphate dehydratase/enolase-phosphatase E1
MSRTNFKHRLYSSEDPKNLICQLCQNFYDIGWVTGSGGGMSIKVDDKVFVAPSGVQKEDLIVQDVFTLSSEDKDIVIEAPQTPNLKQSACTPLWYEVFKHRPAARSVIHTHSMNAQLVTLLNGDQAKEFRITHFEMLKGVGGHGYQDELVVPIIDNRPTEDQLAEQLGEAVKNYPKANAVLVRRHGLYVWGDSWQEAKIHAECYDYLFETALKARELGVDVTEKPQFSTYNVPVGQSTNGKRKIGDVDSAQESIGKATRTTPSFAHLLLDIEGTTTPLAFVKETLFPYSSDKLRTFLSAHTEEARVKALFAEILAQYELDKVDASLTLPPRLVVTGADIESMGTYLLWIISLDRKVSPLKKLQGFIWQDGYESGEILGQVYDDVPLCFQRVTDRGGKVSIYSSGSKHAQQLIFRYSDKGDLRPFLSCYFDTKVGFKQDAESYREINLSLGLTEDPASVLFATDQLVEAVAARAAGMQVLVAVRPGNTALPSSGVTFSPYTPGVSLTPQDAPDVNHFYTVTTFDDIF